MITGTGIDIVEVKRVTEKIEKENGFREKVFSKNEIAYCEARPLKYTHYAARFAAKEAFLKATGKGLSWSFDLCDIEIINETSGKPIIKLHGKFLELQSSKNANVIHLTITHTADTAVATVIIEE